tara:strand:+ start:260 stop:709 length:450 start_codon:yes stop_codon:yes gene_type:complete
MIKKLSFKTNFGWISIKEVDERIVSIKFGKKNNENKSENLVKVKNQIQEYLRGQLKVFNINIYMNGTILQKRIWRELQKIPYGKTKSYGQIAKKFNTSPRYIGNVCGLNQHLLVVPCHRVVRSDNTLGGFSSLGGIKLKKRLIDLENDE